MKSIEKIILFVLLLIPKSDLLIHLSENLSMRVCHCNAFCLSHNVPWALHIFVNIFFFFGFYVPMHRTRLALSLFWSTAGIDKRLEAAFLHVNNEFIRNRIADRCSAAINNRRQRSPRHFECIFLGSVSTVFTYSSCWLITNLRAQNEIIHLIGRKVVH